MIIGIEEEIAKLYGQNILEKLLFDKTTKTNILWATDAYDELGEDYSRDKEIQIHLITGKNSFVIKNRAQKEMEKQSERTRQHAEVFTPLWICRKMNDHADAVWFQQETLFFDKEGNPTERILFPETKRKTPEWQRYVDAKKLEITCGEAPYLVSRYDVASGEWIEIKNRVGILDRKLRVVNENTETEEEWMKWTIRAFQSVYGYEFQGDNVLIARINLLMTFEEYLDERWKRRPTPKEYEEITNVIAWNIWQMDGLLGTIPYCKAEEEYEEVSLFGEMEEAKEEIKEQPPCRIYDWRGDRSLKYLDVNTGGRNMKFDFVIGNPPYQDETVGDKNYASPIYHLFLDEAYKVSDRVELIHPARFLFNAGGTPKPWNAKMLKDPHLKVLYHELNSANIFPNTDIKGGIVITYHDLTQNFGAIETYTAYPELNRIKRKVWTVNAEPFSNIVSNRGLYRFSKLAYEECPEEMAKITDPRISPSSFIKMTTVFFDEKPNDGHEYVQIYGLVGRDRALKWLRKDFMKPVDSFSHYKVFVPKANGSGALGEVLSTPVIGRPVIGHTETFLTIGNFVTEEEATHCLKYIKTKFVRALIGILKVTQNSSAETWKYVPMQDFTEHSDIDWSKSISDIDKQLYSKYGLDDEEIDFIESHVKEMA